MAIQTLATSVLERSTALSTTSLAVARTGTQPRLSALAAGAVDRFDADGLESVALRRSQLLRQRQLLTRQRLLGRQALVARRGVGDDRPAPLALGRNLPQISQLHPTGAERGGYPNAETNCGPASMAMVARGRPNAWLDGRPVAGMTDAELITRLGAHGQTDQDGTSPNGIIAMAEQLGMQTRSSQGGFDRGFYDRVLAEGGSVIANGALKRNGEVSGHYVTVTGRDATGHYVVNDPWTNRQLRWSPAELDAFLRSNPVNGGWSIGVI